VKARRYYRATIRDEADEEDNDVEKKDNAGYRKLKDQTYSRGCLQLDARVK
jgi:hypothetical protein